MTTCSLNSHFAWLRLKVFNAFLKVLLWESSENRLVFSFPPSFIHIKQKEKNKLIFSWFSRVETWIQGLWSFKPQPIHQEAGKYCLKKSKPCNFYVHYFGSWCSQSDSIVNTLVMRMNTVILECFLKGAQSLCISENTATHFLVQLKEQITPISPPKAWFIYHHQLDSSCTSKSSIWSCNLTHTCNLSTRKTIIVLWGNNVQKRLQDRIFGRFSVVS